MKKVKRDPNLCRICPLPRSTKNSFYCSQLHRKWDEERYSGESIEDALKRIEIRNAKKHATI